MGRSFTESIPGVREPARVLLGRGDAGSSRATVKNGKSKARARSLPKNVGLSERCTAETRTDWTRLEEPWKCTSANEEDQDDVGLSQEMKNEALALQNRPGRRSGYEWA